jgi:eukaryotic-like serine/threonine-protein kinase
LRKIAPGCASFCRQSAPYELEYSHAIIEELCNPLVMTPERWKQIEELYHSAVDSGEEARTLLFAQASPDVRNTVIEMLAQQSAENILDRPAWEGAAEMDLAVPPLTPETQLGPYRIEGILGQGGMGAVYRAFDSRLGRKVAIKILPAAVAADPERLRRFEQEAWAAGTLDHPNVLTIYDVGTHDDTSYLVSELLEGETLRDRLRGGALPRHKAFEYARLIAAGLTAAHERGITHRDLKPENLFITRDGRLKILDFCLAKLAGSESGIETLSEGIKIDSQSSGSQPGIILGTVGYMSPEQVQAEAVDNRSDLFNLGAILYEMLTGRRAFQGSTPIETLQAILKEGPPLSDDDPNLGGGLARFLRHCLEKDPRERFQSAKDLAFDLEALGPPSSAAAPSGAKWKFTTAAAAISVLVLILFLAGRQFVFVQAAPPPSFRQITFRPGLVTSGRFTRDGQTVVYSAAWEGRPVESFATRIDGPESRPLELPSAAGVLGVSSAGELLLTLGCELNWAECRGTIARMPLEGKVPREIVDDADYADWNPEGTNFLIVRGLEGRYRLEYPIGNVLYETAGWITHPRFSPKGDRIAFLNHPMLGNNDGSVEMVDLNGHRTTLAAGLKGLKGLAWSLSSEEVWFSGSPKRNCLLYAVTLAGKQRVVLQTPGGMEIQDIARDGRVLLLQQNARSNMIYRPPGALNDRTLSWFDWSTAADLSSTGSTLLFYEWGEGTGGIPTVYLRETGGGEAVGLGEGKPLALAPDGKWVLALRGSPSQLTLLPTGAGEPKLLPRSGIEEYYSGAWFPGGKKLLFSGETSDHIPRSFIQDVDGGDARPVTAAGVRATLISPDGTRLAAYGPEGDYYVAPIDGGEPQKIRGAERGDELIQWSANGRYLYVKGPNESLVELFRIDLMNGQRELWKKLEVPSKVGFVGIQNGPGAIRITPDGKSYVYTSWQALGELYIAEGLK